MLKTTLTVRSRERLAGDEMCTASEEHRSDEYRNAAACSLLGFVSSSLSSWRGDNQELIVFRSRAGTSLYDLTTGSTRPLEANSSFWH